MSALYALEVEDFGLLHVLHTFKAFPDPLAPRKKLFEKNLAATPQNMGSAHLVNIIPQMMLFTPKLGQECLRVNVEK